MPIVKRNLYVPRNQRLRLSSALIHKMSPGGTDYFVRDEVERRLNVKVTPKGQKTFVLRYRNANGVERKFRLGAFPDINVSTARELARKSLLEAAMGNDPATKRHEDRHGYSFQQYSERFMQEHAEVHLRPKTQYDYRRLLDTVLVPAIGNKKMRNVSRSDVAKIQSDLRDTRFQANRAVKLVRRIFNYAIEVDDLPLGSDPTSKIKLFTEERRERLLSNDEIVRVGRAIAELSEEQPNRLFAYKAILFLFLTGCRKSEALRLRWEDIDSDHKILRFKQTKTEPRNHYISDELFSFLDHLDSRRFSEWLFLGRDPERHIVDLKKPWDQVRERTGLSDVRLHDVRHTFLTDLLSISDLQTASFVAGHKSVRSTMRYIHSRSESKRIAIERAAGEKGAVLFGRTSRNEEEA